MEKKDQELAQKLADVYNKLNLLFHVILAFPLVAFIWLYLESNAGGLSTILVDESTADIVAIVLPVLTIGVIISAFIVFTSGLRSIDPSIGIASQCEAYFKKAIVLYAMLELGLMLNVAGYYLNQKNIHLAMFMIVLVFFSIYKPTFYRMSKHLNITGEERDFLIDCRRIARGEDKIEKNTHARL